MCMHYDYCGLFLYRNKRCEVFAALSLAIIVHRMKLRALLSIEEVFSLFSISSLSFLALLLTMTH